MRTRSNEEISRDAEVEARKTYLEESYLIDVLADFLNRAAPKPPPESFDEKRFFHLACSHDVAALVSTVLEKNPAFFSAALIERFVAAKMQEVFRDSAQLMEFADVERVFAENEIRFLPLKGAVLKRIYPETFCRSMGDFDVLVEEKDFERAGVALKSFGYRVVGSCEHHDAFKKPPFYIVELHRKLTKAFAGMKNGATPAWKRLIPERDDNAPDEKTFKFRFSNEDFYCYMLEHLLKHWLTSKTTARFYLDVAVYTRRFGATLDRSAIERRFERSGVLDFMRNVERLVAVWFDGAPSDPLIDEATRKIFSDDSTNYLTSGLTRGTLETGKATATSRIGGLARLVFAPGIAKRREFDLQRRPKGTRTFWRFYYWLCFVANRVCSRSARARFWAFWRVSNSQVEKTRAFQRKIGLNPARFNFEEWRDDD